MDSLHILLKVNIFSNNRAITKGQKFLQDNNDAGEGRCQGYSNILGFFENSKKMHFESSPLTV